MTNAHRESQTESSPAVVMVTGGAQGIGRAIAYMFGQRGALVSFADISEDAGAEALQHLNNEGVTAIFERVDTSQPAAVARWMARTVSELGPPTVLINNAGINANGPFLELTAEDFDRVLAVNVRGAMLCAQAAAKEMVNANSGGSIINIASTRAFMSEPNTEAYSASKGAIIALTHAMAMSLGPYRIRVNAISPGWIEVGDWQFSERAHKPAHSREDNAQHPIGRVGRPEDIAQACVYLAHHADFMTGQNLMIDGGMTIKMIYA